jgi:hypothetical protein
MTQYNNSMDETDSSSTSNYSMALDRLRAMRQQEAKSYQVSTVHLDRTDGCPEDIPLYLEWRRAMIGWHYNISATCKFQKDTVEIAMSIVDRFVAVKTELLREAHRYQVACMAGLYIAAKIHEQQCLTPKQMETLSCGRFLSQDIEAMEQEILTAIEWRVNPPTAASFCRTLVELIPLELVPDRATVLDVAESHISLAMPETIFLEVSASSLALASVMNALRCVLGHSILNHFLDGFSDALLMKDNRNGLLQQKLRAIVVQSLSTGKILNETMATAYQEDAEVGFHKSSQYTGSPRSITERLRYINVQI